MQSSSLPPLFKGIALFTPSGDLVYTVDRTKQNRWHLQLCVVLQELLGLPEPPHFLVPCYTATIDRWQHPHTGTVETAAELYPLIRRHRALLSSLFEVEDRIWQEVASREAACDPMVLAAYRQQFPQLWEDHDLIIRLDDAAPFGRVGWKMASSSKQPMLSEADPMSEVAESDSTRQGYVLRLFVSGHSAATERTLQQLHELLEQYLPSLYTLKVIDVLKHPEQAERDQITATPTLVRIWPQPTRRIVGELSDINQVLQLLSQQRSATHE